MRTAKLIYGTAGWSYDDWLGLFYPQGTTPADYLALYARTFPGVEVDSTYYGIPSPRTVAGAQAPGRCTEDRSGTFRYHGCT